MSMSEWEQKWSEYFDSQPQIVKRAVRDWPTEGGTIREVYLKYDTGKIDTIWYQGNEPFASLREYDVTITYEDKLEWEDVS